MYVASMRDIAAKAGAPTTHTCMICYRWKEDCMLAMRLASCRANRNVCSCRMLVQALFAASASYMQHPPCP